MALLLVLLAACGDDGSAMDSGVDAATIDGGSRIDAGAGVDSGADGGADGGGGLDGGGEDAGPTPPCDYADPRPPPAGVLWAAPLSASGAGTLLGHGHDDGRGPVGFCAGTRVEGEPFYRLVAAGFESDDDVDGDGDNDPLPVDFYRDAPAFSGVGESGGRINIYIEVLDEAGVPLHRDSAPEIRLTRTILDGPTDAIPLDRKPPNEFQTNVPMTGGGTRYGIAVEGASDRVINMRLPNNHHVTFILVFQRA